MKQEHIKEDVFIALRDQNMGSRARLHAVGLKSGERFNAFVTGFAIEQDVEQVHFTIPPDQAERWVSLSDIDFIAVLPRP
jgi:hypothetical protein